jgi:hypothetical protein
MQRLDILLRDLFHRHGRNIGPLARFGQRQRIIGIIVLPTPERGSRIGGRVSVPRD